MFGVFFYIGLYTQQNYFVGLCDDLAHTYINTRRVFTGVIVQNDGLLISTKAALEEMKSIRDIYVPSKIR